MTYRRLLLIIGIVIGLLAGIAVQSERASAAPVRHHCQEDEACFAWSRDGNLQRGVTDLRTGKFRIVNACEFRTLWMHGDFGGPSLRGDWWALRHSKCAR